VTRDRKATTQHETSKAFVVVGSLDEKKKGAIILASINCRNQYFHKDNIRNLPPFSRAQQNKYTGHTAAQKLDSQEPTRC
jgi:hypothetical protein